MVRIYTITDPVDIHARPAGILVKTAKSLDSNITVTKADGKSTSATKLMSLMGMGIKTGETITVTVEGGNEESMSQLWSNFLRLICKYRREMIVLSPLAVNGIVSNSDTSRIYSAVDGSSAQLYWEVANE